MSAGESDLLLNLDHQTVIVHNVPCKSIGLGLVPGNGDIQPGANNTSEDREMGMPTCNNEVPQYLEGIIQIEEEKGIGIK